MGNIFGERLEILRGSRTQREFADFIGIPLNSYTNWKNSDGDPQVKNVRLAATKLGVSSDWLLGLTDQRAPATPAPAPFFNVKGLHAAEAPPGCPNCARLNATVDTLLERLKEHAVEAGRSRPARKKPSSEPVKSSLYPA